MEDKIIDINDFLQKAGSFPVLSEEEEKSLLALSENEDQTAINKLYQSNQRLVISVAKKYFNEKIDSIALIEEGLNGLKKAIKSYSKEKDISPSSWFTWHINISITNYLVKVYFPALQNMIEQMYEKNNDDSAFQGIFLHFLLSYVLWQAAENEDSAKDYLTSALSLTFPNKEIADKASDECFVFEMPIIKKISEEIGI